MRDSGLRIGIHVLSEVDDRPGMSLAGGVYVLAGPAALSPFGSNIAVSLESYGRKGGEAALWTGPA